MDNGHVNRNSACLTAPLDPSHDADVAGVQCSNKQSSTQSRGNELALRRPGFYTASYITERYIEHLEKNHNKINTSQRDALPKLAKLVARHSNPDIRDWLSKDTLTKYMELFARLFFCNHKISFIRIATDGDKADPDHNAGRHGSINRDRDQSPRHMRIWLSKRLNLNGKEDHVRRRANILHTLLYKLTHAVFLMYCCRGSKCSANKNVRKTVGFRGHEPSWAAAVKASRKRIYNMPSSRVPEKGRGCWTTPALSHQKEDRGD